MFGKIAYGLSIGGTVLTGGRGTIIGTLKDSSGAIIPRADVTITNQQTGHRESTTTDLQGRYTSVPLPPGAGSMAFRRAWQNLLLPALDAFAPELLIVSAGFDAHRDDPLAELQLETDDYAWMTDELASLAARHSRGRIISLLEGGYDLDALAASAAAQVRALMHA